MGSPTCLRALWALPVALLLLALPAYADDRAEARALAERAIEDYDAGRLDAAEAALLDAERRFSHPIHAIYLGRIAAQRGQLVRARARYREAVGAADTAIAATARKELDQLEPRIPSLMVVAATGDVIVRVDGVEIEREGDRVWLDPGSHDVEVVADGTRVVERTFRLSEGEVVRVEARAASSPGSPDTSEGAADTWNEDASFAPEGGDTTAGTDPLLAAGAGIFAVGGAAAIVGIVTGVMTLSRADEVKAQCAGVRCPASVEADLASARDLATAATVSFVIAGVFSGVGITLMVASTGDDEVAVRLGPGAVSLSGRF